MTASSELRDLSEALRGGVEELLLEVDAPAAAAHLKEAEVAVSRFCVTGATDSGLEALETARKALALAKDAIAEASTGRDLLEEAIAWAGELRTKALDEIAGEPASEGVSSGASVFGFHASRGAPALHEPREMPALSMIERPRPWDADDAERADEAPKKQVAPAVVDLKRLARDAMEDMAILGGLRRLGDDEPWVDAEGFEERLLANLDLFWALDAPLRDDVPSLGGARALFEYVMEWSTPDWGRAFALSFGLGCTKPEVALRWIMLAMRRSSPTIFSAYVSGLSLGSSSHIDRTVVDELRKEASPELYVALLEIAHRRRVFEPSAIVPLLAHPEERVKEAAVIALRSAPAEVAIASLDRLLATTEGTLAAVTADELARRGKPQGLEYLRALLPKDADPKRRRLALGAIALAGIAKDEPLVVEYIREREDAPVWLSFFGRPSVVPLIVDALSTIREKAAGVAAVREQAERAFVRVTGLSHEGDRRALTARWEESGLAKKGGRLRHGEPYAAAEVLTELQHARARQGERRVLARELPLLVPSAPVVDLDGFVATQAALLATIDPD